uniref:Senescence-associated protein n=1 Tax=Salix viminalis TaxID=40686 RepID=A0A6N2MKG5_SALVM
MPALSWHNSLLATSESPSSKPRVRAMLEPMTFLNQYTVPNSVTAFAAESSWHCLRCHHGEIAAMIKTRSNPLSKPRAHAMTCMNQKRAAEFTGIAFAAETADTAESAATSVPRAASTHSHYSTLLQQASTPAELPLVHRPLLVCRPGNSRPSLREAVLLEGLGGTNRSDMGLNLSGSWQQGHSATYNTPSRGPRGSSTARAWPTARASGAKRPLLQVGNRTAGARVASSPDSDLEAFSHNPTHGSFAPLAFQPSAMTNCANQRFLSRADIEGSKSNVAMNAWLPQASYPCGNFSDTSSFKFRRSKGSIGHAFTVRIRTGNQNQTSFYPFVPHEISVLVELILGHLRYLLTDVPPQPNSPPDNVFRPDRPPKRPWVQKEGSAPPPIHGITPTYPTPLKSFHKVGLESSSTGSSFPADSASRSLVVSLDSRQGHRIPLVRTSSESTVRRPGKAPERAVPSPSPGRHATTRSRRGSSSSSPPTADGFGTGTPEPSPQSQSFSRGYGSILPTSLAYIVPSTRGCSPWRPDAVMSTTGRGRHSVLRIFKGRRGRTGHHATCGALPAAGPYLRLSRFQEKITLPEAPADVSGLPNVAVSRHVPDRLTHVQVPFTWNLSPLRPSKFSFEYLLLPPRSAPTAAPPGLAPWVLQRPPRTHRARPTAVSAQLGTVTRLPVHPASPVLLTKNGPLGALDSVARLNEAAAPSYLFKGNFGGNQLLDGSISLSPYTQVRRTICTSSLRASTRVPLASPRSGIVHHLSGPDRHALTRTLLRRSRSVGGATLEGIPPVSFLAPYGFTRPLTRTHVRLLGPCFKTGRMGSPQADARSAHVPGHAVTARAAVHDRSDGISTGAATAIRIGPRPSRSADRLSPFHIRPGRIAGPHPLPSRQFQALFDSLLVLHLPSRYLFAIGLSPIFSLGRNLPPDWGCIPKQPDSQTAPRGAAGSSHDGALTLSGAPSRGLGPGPPLRTLLQTTIRTPRAPILKLGISRASLKANARGSGRSRGDKHAHDRVRGSLNHRLSWHRAEDSIRQPRRERAETSIRPALVSRGSGATMRDTQADVPSTRRPRAQLAFKDSMVHGILQFTPSIAFRYVLHRCESRDIRCRESFRLSQKEGAPPTPRLRGRAPSTQFPWRFSRRGSLASRVGRRCVPPRHAWTRGRVPPEPSLSCHGFAGRSAGAGFDNDPSAGSPTETLLRLLLPLNDKVQWTSRDVASGEPPTSPRSEHFTGPFNR